MSRYPSNTDHYKRRSGKGRRHGHGYAPNCWRQRNPNVYGYNHGYGDNRFDSHLPFEGSWVEEDVLRWLQTDRSWSNQRMGNNWQHQNRTHHGANSFSSVRHINLAGSSQNNCSNIKTSNVNISTASENISDKPASLTIQQPPPPGSEEARLEAVANTTDKLRQCLFRNKTESIEVLKTLLSGSDSEADCNKMQNANLDIPVPQPDLPPSPTDWPKICMSSRLKSPSNSELVDDDDVVFVAKPVAETVSLDSDDSISGDVSASSHKIKVESSVESSNPIIDICLDKTQSNLQDSSGNSKEKSNNLSTDSAVLRPVLLSSAENDNPVGSLKQNVVRQLLKMGSAGIKDIVNNPTSRKFQYALKHLVREHKVAWTRQLRVLAETRIQNRNKEIINHEHLLDPDIAVNISNLPQEFIEQLGDLLKMDLFDTAEFQETNTDDAEQGLRDLELLCSQVTQEAEKAFQASMNSNEVTLIEENLAGKKYINVTQNDSFNVPNIKHESSDSDIPLNTPDNTKQVSKYSDSPTSHGESLDGVNPNLEKHAECQIVISGTKEIRLSNDSQQSPFQPIKTVESERNSLVVKDLVFDNVQQSQDIQTENSRTPKHVVCRQYSVEKSKVQESSIDKGNCFQLSNEERVTEEVDNIGNVENAYCAGKTLEIKSKEYVKSNLNSVDNILNVHTPVLNETEINLQVENSRDSELEKTLGNVAHSSAGWEPSDFQSVVTSKRICTPAAKKCYNFNSLAVSVSTQTESSYRKFDVCEIISELEKEYHLPGHLIAVLREYLEPKKTSVPKPQAESLVPPTLPLICVSKSLFNKLDSNGTSNTGLPPPHGEQRTLPRKSTDFNDSCSVQGINDATLSQARNQSIHPENQAQFNIQINPNDSNLPEKNSVISNDISTVYEHTYLKMLDIDSKIHQLMGMKIDLYKQLQLSFLSQKMNHLSSSSISKGNTSNSKAENPKIEHSVSNSNIQHNYGITPISELEKRLTSDALISRPIPSLNICSVDKRMSNILEVIPNDDSKESSSSHINQISEGNKTLSIKSHSSKTSGFIQRNQINECSVEPIAEDSIFSYSTQSFMKSKSKKNSKKVNKNARNKKKTPKSVSPPGQNNLVSQTSLEETDTNINVDNNDKIQSPGTRKRAKISARELQSLGFLSNGENECSTVVIKVEASDSDVEANNLGRTRRQRYSLLDEKLLENQVYNMDTNMPNIDRKRKSISICGSEEIDNLYSKKTKTESPVLKETENIHGILNMNSEKELRVGCVYNDELQQNDNANKSFQLPISIASKAAEENLYNTIASANLEFKQRSTIIACANVANNNVVLDTDRSFKSKEESEHSDENCFSPSTVEVLSKIRKCTVVLERLPKKVLSKTACLEDRSETHATFSLERMALENASKLSGNTDDRDEDTNSVSSVSGGGTPRRLCGPDDGEVEARGRTKVNQSLLGHKGSILDLQCIGRLVLAAGEDGCVYCYSLKSGRLKRTLQCSESAVTCLCISDSASLGLKFIFCGSLDGFLRCFTFETGDAVNEPVYVGSGIQCIDHNWGNIYIGTKDGSVKIFNCKKFEILTNYFECSKESIFTIKTTKEGPRKVMLIGSRSQPVIVRDSATGLYLRSVTQSSNFTVYTIVLDSSLVYCGTSVGTIPVYNFTNGEEVCHFNAGTGVVCLKLYNDLLFAGCYDGFIYIFSIQDKNLITKVSGPGKMILSMEIAKNRIICSSKDKKLEVFNFPVEVRKYLKDTKHR